VINDILPSGVKTFEEARGRIISDYQSILENQWIDTLNKKYEVKIDQNVLAKVKTKILK